MIKKDEKRIRLKAKIRAKVSGILVRPRLSVFRSNKFIYAQVIDDVSGKTLAEASDIKITKGTKTERAKQVGNIIAEVCGKLKIKEIVFDRNGFKYTGRIKLVADAARAGGLKF
ncbi:50S ribosomal protein L18 [Candidatus Nomurabacteria bacterium CG_4_9_14_0_2_um_filter_32_10]|uniref:Large ribosomal subunit protein uL18 n=3 Tax=Candidatus Nomuraibacteriota TaxID=1752729 RepID=A0A2H0CGJ1_9BACT|nr:MAG: 50S ribosomal protein L18 [Candidatus Nomurabacteria bacterium CG22_combo_CG10-13_8_21_14_all_32_8]PIZ85381.1 MAG: 50S ribosomal protein L18 [Candidatus Nomurabacteria bacterium CG_4_10_14_0_2_um_filter_33_9]PJC49352.1 MAG: 50S ribosomal protein L18 [Candidatus Nomurabacteria bacterium CG_4_9_14_0_2_um_filter_32_10]